MNPAPSQAVIFTAPVEADAARSDLSRLWLADESDHLDGLLEHLDVPREKLEAITGLASSLVTRVRARSDEQSPLDAFMQLYDLSSEEGVLLMCLAEALLRIPDGDTADRLIADKLGDADWEAHLGKSSSLFVNASTWGLMLTGKLVRLSESTQRNFAATLKRMVGQSGEPVIRQAVRQAMRIMGHQFVMGRTIAEALKRSQKGGNRRFRYSFDMLGEAALTAADAVRYWQAYQRAIEAIGNRGEPGPAIHAAPSISVKLSALHPRYEVAQRERVMDELAPRLKDLAVRARAAGIALTIDAEEADRLQLSLDLFDAVYGDSALDDWNGFGLVVQAYQKRAPRVLQWLADRAGQVGRRIPLRLVKGAYWDTEIKRGQEQGLDGYPVFTRKVNTDVSYLACARFLLERREMFYPQFATHNAHTLAAVYHLAGNAEGYEFQRLHGMGEELYEEVIGEDKLGLPCRVYAPVGSHEDLLPYLVRRLLENGANTSFVNRIVDADEPVAGLVADPIAAVRANQPRHHPLIPLPRDLYGEGRVNSRGVNLFDPIQLADLARAMAEHPAGDWQAAPLSVGGSSGKGDWNEVLNPADRRQTVGRWQAADEAAVDTAIERAVAAWEGWDQRGVEERAACLDRIADALEQQMPRFLQLLTREAGKTLPDGVAEVREAVDFCRYYAQQARSGMTLPELLPGPTGESNQLSVHGRGVFVCISPWNFPLAIFTGQVVAALVTGNAVLAKPAEQTVLVAHAVVRLMHAAGVPAEVLHLLPGDGATVGGRLTRDPRIAGVAFTGSTETARLINQTLAARTGSLPRLVAETGGQNVMLADSSALPEQLIKDVVGSAFHSAGQRCSALRVLFVQRDVADRVLEMLTGAMDELQVGDPALLSTDVGPVIDLEAQKMLAQHAARMDREGRLVGRARLPGWADHGSFFAPVAYEIDGLEKLEREVFGPVLHVVRYRARDLDRVIDAVNATGYGLTLGIHSRIESTVERIRRRVRVGNCYVNRNMIGAVVGVQPFGGEGLSGTGPKAGGPRYLDLFTTERTLTINTAAVGGNASLLALD